VTLWRQWPISMVLVCWGLSPPDQASCFAADPAPAKAAAAAAPQKAELKPALPVRGGVILAAGQATVAVPMQALAPAVRAKAEAKPVPPATKRGSLMGALVRALGDGSEERERAARAMEDQNVRNLEPQLRPQFQQLLYSELAFMRRVSKPDPKAFAEVAKAARAGLQAPLREFIITRYMGRRVTPGDANPDPRTAMQNLLLPLAKEKLGPEKSQLYAQECDKRREARKHAVVMNLVAGVDERLALTTQQRTKLVESLTAHFENPWDGFYDVFGMNASGQNIPAIRDESIVPLLDEQQKGVWKQTVKQSGAYYSGVIMRGGNMQGEAAEIQEIAHIAEEGQNGK
jgi:hypothetical protein